MADENQPQAPQAPAKGTWTPELIRYIATISVLAILVVVLALTGQRDGMNTILGALAGYATSAHPGGGSNPSTVAAATMGLAFAARALGHALGA